MAQELLPYSLGWPGRPVPNPSLVVNGKILLLATVAENEWRPYANPVRASISPEIH